MPLFLLWSHCLYLAVFLNEEINIIKESLFHVNHAKALLLLDASSIKCNSKNFNNHNCAIFFKLHMELLQHKKKIAFSIIKASKFLHSNDLAHYFVIVKQQLKLHDACCLIFTRNIHDWHNCNCKESYMLRCSWIYPSILIRRIGLCMTRSDTINVHKAKAYIEVLLSRFIEIVALLSF